MFKIQPRSKGIKGIFRKYELDVGCYLTVYRDHSSPWYSADLPTTIFTVYVVKQITKVKAILGSFAMGVWPCPSVVNHINRHFNVHLVWCERCIRNIKLSHTLLCKQLIFCCYLNHPVLHFDESKCMVSHAVNPLGVMASPVLPDSSAYAHYVFNTFDQDRNGTISFEVSEKRRYMQTNWFT